MALAIDSSTPAIATQTSGTVAVITSASFTPPAGSLLLIRWSGDAPGSPGTATPTITDSLGVPLAYALVDWVSDADAPGAFGQAACWWAQVGASAAMTVTVTSGAASGSRASALHITVLTGHDPASPIGAHGKASSKSAASIAQNYTAQSTGGWGFIVTTDWDVIGPQTAGTGCTLTNGGSANLATFITYGFARRTLADNAATVTNTLNVTLAGTSNNLSWTWVEVRAASVASGRGGQFLEFF